MGAAAARIGCESARSAGYRAVLPSVLGVLPLARARMLTAAPPVACSADSSCTAPFSCSCTLGSPVPAASGGGTPGTGGTKSSAFSATSGGRRASGGPLDRFVRRVRLRLLPAVSGVLGLFDAPLILGLQLGELGRVFDLDVCPMLKEYLRITSMAGTFC